MYLPTMFREDRLELLSALIRARPLATLVAHGPGGLSVDHIPMLFDAASGRLRGHIARANPLYGELEHGAAAVAVFHGPQHYISPSWYPSKREHGRVVPTWNYAVVHVHGVLRRFEDRAGLLQIVRDLTDAEESAMPEPWSVDDAPAEFIDGMLGAIAGVELAIGRMEGKWKMSQNRPPADRAGVRAALCQSSGSDAQEMASLIARAQD
jgi:transcriptional regulator